MIGCNYHLRGYVFSSPMFNPVYTPHKKFTHSLCLSCLLLFSFSAFGIGAAGKETVAKDTLLDEHSLASTVSRALSHFNTPGMAVGVIHQGKIVHLDSFGIANRETNAPVDENTYFRLASTSKAFTAASLAILVDEGKLQWDDKVIDYLPGFRMMDPWVTAEFTIRDLLSHRSGLIAGAGDSMIWPEPSGFSRSEMIHNLRYLSPEYSFRSTYAYNNVFYITAGEVVAKIANQPWEDFVAKRIFAPLGMECFAGDMPDSALSNVAMAYGYNDDEGIYPIPRNGVKGEGLISAAAGGIVCNASSMLKWLNFLLTRNDANHDEVPLRLTDINKGAKNTPVFSAARLSDMWSPNTILKISKNDKQLDNTQFRSYAMGWQLRNILGYEAVYHTGTLSGYQAYVTLVPALDLGIVLLNNGSNSGARTSVMQSILRAYIPGAKQQDWVTYYHNEQTEARQKYLSKKTIPVGSGEVLLPISAYAGEYADNWFGTMTITQSGSVLRVESAKMVTLTGTLEPFEANSFVIRWDNKNAARDSFIHFDVDPSHQVTAFTLHPFSVDVSNEHEYRDMYFEKRVRGK